MNPLWRKSHLIALLALTAPALAGHGRGNGGDAIYCDIEGQESAEVFDFYEQQIPKVEGSLEEVLEAYWGNLAKIDSLSADYYRKRAAHVLATGEFKEKVVLTDISDTGPHDIYFLPEGCEFQQAAIRLVEPERFIIDDDLFQLMTPIDQAGLILHEVLYADLKDHAANEDSATAREFVLAIARDEVGELALSDYFAFFRSRDPQGNFDYEIPRSFLYHGNECLMNRLAFSDDGKDVLYCRTKTMRWKEKIAGKEYALAPLHYLGNPFKLHASGVLRAGYLLEPQLVTTDRYLITTAGSVGFYPNGGLHRIAATSVQERAGETWQTVPLGLSQKYPRAIVIFDQAGQIEKINPALADRPPR